MHGYLAFKKPNPYADEYNGPRTAMLHGCVIDEITEYHLPTGRVYLDISRCGPIPRLDTKPIVDAMRHTKYANETELVEAARKIAAEHGWELTYRP